MFPAFNHSFHKPFFIIVILFFVCVNSLAQFSGGIGDGYHSGNSNQVSFSDLQQIQIPVSPIASAANQITGTRFTAHWSESLWASRYILDVDDSDDFSSPLANYNNLEVGKALSIIVMGLELNKNYYYRVRAVNSLGTSQNSNTINVFTSPKALTITGIFVYDKVYDGNKDASLAGTAELVGIEFPDQVSVDNSNVLAEFIDKNANLNKTITISGYVLTGTDADAYDLIQPNYLTASIYPKTIHINDILVQDKEYDGNQNATFTGGTLSGKIDTDNLFLQNGNSKFIDPVAGMQKEVIMDEFSLSGSDSLNYSIDQPFYLSANIFRATPIIQWDNPQDIYHGTALSELQLNATSNVDGSYSYTPFLGYVLAVGNNQVLRLNFVPNDRVNYNITNDSVFINVLNVTGVFELNNKHLKIFPNPATSQISISGLSKLPKKNCSVRIIDNSGREFYFKKEIFINELQTFDVGFLPVGIYKILINNENDLYSLQFLKL